MAFFQTNKGKHVDGTLMIAPITGLVNGRTQFIGTGFFIDHAGGFVTAKHCLEMDYIDDKSHFVILQRINDKQFIPRSIPNERIYFHRNADICIAKPVEVQRGVGGTFSTPILDYSFNNVSIGEGVSTVAYPRSEPIDLDNEEWKFQLDLFNGVVKDIHKRCPTARLSNSSCVQTTINVMSGASGGPVFGKSRKVIGINSVSFDLGKSKGDPISFVTPLKYLLDIEVDYGYKKVLFKDILDDQIGNIP